MSRTIDSGVVSRMSLDRTTSAIAEDRHPVDEAEQFVQTVAHVEDARS